MTFREESFYFEGVWEETRELKKLKLKTLPFGFSLQTLFHFLVWLNFIFAFQFSFSVYKRQFERLACRLRLRYKVLCWSVCGTEIASPKSPNELTNLKTVWKSVVIPLNYSKTWLKSTLCLLRVKNRRSEMKLLLDGSQNLGISRVSDLDN